jgi:dihydroorotase
MGSFSFPVAEAAIADGFLPDTISTDLYAGRDGTTPSHDLPQVMSKFMAAGMPEREVFAAVTAHPARILGLEAEIGSLTVGACADLTVLRWNQTQSPPLVDVDGVERLGGRWETALTVRAGEVVR